MKILGNVFENPKVLVSQLALTYGINVGEFLSSVDWEEVPGNTWLYRTQSKEPVTGEPDGEWTYVSLQPTAVDPASITSTGRLTGIYTLFDSPLQIPKGIWKPHALSMLDSLFTHLEPEMKQALVKDFETDRIWHCVGQEGKMASFVTIYGGKHLTVFEVSLLNDIVISLSKRVL